MADPDYEFLEGFDKYGTLNSNSVNNSSFGIAAAMRAGEWTTINNNSNTDIKLIAPLAGTGAAMRIASGSTNLKKSLPGSYARCVGGVHFRTATFANAQNIIQFYDNAVQHVSIAISTAGKLVIYRGGTLLFTSTEVYSVNTVYCVEWDVTIHDTTGIVKVWMNGVLTSVNLTGQDTRNAGNSTFDSIYLAGVNAISMDFDHLYVWCYTAAGGSETPALTNPIIETSFPSADNDVDFAVGAATLGTTLAMMTTNDYLDPTANRIFATKWVAECSGTLTDIAYVPRITHATAKMKLAIYSDVGGVPTTLLGQTAEFIGHTVNIPKQVALAASVSIVDGTSYWLCWIADAVSSVGLYCYDDSAATGKYMTHTYTTALPSTFTVNGTHVPQLIYGILTGVTERNVAVNEPAFSAVNYNSSTTVGHEDLFDFPALTGTPSVIYSVCIKVAALRTDAGAKTMTIRTKSGASDVNGSLSAYSPPVSTNYNSSLFKVDPNTGVAWTPSGLNSAKHGYKIES